MVARVAMIMNVFDVPGRAQRLDQVVSNTGLPRSSVHRILTQLHDARLLDHGPDGYCLAASTISGNGDHSLLRSAASPMLERLNADTSLVVHLGVLSGANVVYLDKVSGSSGVAVPTRVAGHTPAHASALGKAMLATLPAEVLDGLLGPTLPKSTPATIGDLPTLHQELARIRSRHGLAYDDQELAVGLASVAAPITISAPVFSFSSRMTLVSFALVPASRTPAATCGSASWRRPASRSRWPTSCRPRW